MVDVRQIRRKVDETEWRFTPYRNGERPSYTFEEIVGDSFDSVKKLGINAKHCRMYDMYNPNLGRLRRSATYSELAPTNGLKFFDRFVPPDLRPFAAYKPKQAEWRLAAGRGARAAHQPANVVGEAGAGLAPLPPTHRRQYAVPAGATRFENFATYWGGRARGLDYAQFALHRPDLDTYAINEDRRYHRLYWAPQMFQSQPSCRHARQIIMLPY